jgi:hypothetical protein
MEKMLNQISWRSIFKIFLLHVQKPADWPHYVHSDFKQAASKQELDKVTTETTQR